VAAGFAVAGLAVTVVRFDKTTEAFIAAGGVVNANGSGAGVIAWTGVRDGSGGRTTQTGRGLAIQAGSLDRVDWLAISAGPGAFIGVAASATTANSDNDTRAFISGTATARSVRVLAWDETFVDGDAGVLAGGALAGIGGAAD